MFLPAHSYAVEDAFPPSEIIDVSDWDFNEQPKVPLATGWSVFRGSHLVPSGLALGAMGDFSQQGMQAVTMPDVWGSPVTSNVETGHGRASYRIRIRGPKDGHQLALNIGKIRSTLSIDAILYQTRDAPLLLHLLEADHDRRASAPTSEIVTLPSGFETLDLYFHVSNYVHKQGGILSVPVLGNHDVLLRESQLQGYLTSSIALLLLLIAAAAFFGAYGLVQREVYMLFSISAALSACRVVLTGDLIWLFAPDLSLSWKYNLEYAVWFALMGSYFHFMRALFKGYMPQWIGRVIYGITALFIGICLIVVPFFPDGSITLLREPFDLFAFAQFVLVIVILVRALRDGGGVDFSTYVVAAGVCCIFFYETASVLGLISARMEWSQLAVVFGALYYANRVMRHFSEAQQEKDKLSQDLVVLNGALQERAGELEKEKHKAEAASRSKSAFLANMSHELRTPLNAIIGFSDLMVQKTLGQIEPPQYADYVVDIHNSGEHLLNIINDLLDMSKIEAGKLELNLVDTDLMELSDAASRITFQSMEKKRLTFECNVSRNTPLVCIDERLMLQVLLNLLSNAVKFCDEHDTISLSIGISVDGDIEICVSDTGIGIAADKISDVLQPFGKLDNSSSRNIEGTGLGLPLSKAIVEEHGGTLSIESELGVGTTIFITLPKTPNDVKHAHV